MVKSFFCPSDMFRLAMNCFTCSGLFKLVFRARKLSRLAVPLIVLCAFASFSICISMFKIVGSVGSFGGAERI